MLADRVPPRFGAVIGEAYRRLPAGWRGRLEHVGFLCGVDPVFVGLHRWRTNSDGVSYASTPHCCYPVHVSGPADRRRTTVVLPTLVDPAVVVHELGHALDWSLGRRALAAPVTDYATTNRDEAFAEFVVAHTYEYGDRDAWWSDGATRHLLDELAA